MGRCMFIVFSPFFEILCLGMKYSSRVKNIVRSVFMCMQLVNILQHSNCLVMCGSSMKF